MTVLARPITASVVLVLAATVASADTAFDVYKDLRIKPSDVLNGTIVQSKVLPGSEKQVVALVTYLTGDKGEAEAVGVLLVVYRKDDKGALTSLYARDYGAENGGFVGRGEIEIIDLDKDGVGEMFVTWDNVKDKLIQERRGEILLHERSGFRSGWTGAVEYDATKAIKDVAAERRDRFVRKIDVTATMKTRGVTVFFKKTTVAVAGERLQPPKESVETFPLRQLPDPS